MYIDLVMFLNYLVDHLLLMGTNALSGFPLGAKRTALASFAGGLYAGMCLVPGFSFLGNIFWRIVMLAAMSVLAFGLGKTTLRRGILFLILSMALGGIAILIGNGGSLSVILGAAVVLGLCSLGFASKVGMRQFAAVKMKHGGQSVELTALCDTGNTLKDPISGKSVLVVGSDLAWKLLGLTEQQLSSPLETITKHHGLRLIPYRSVGRSSGILLGIRVDQLWINGSPSDMILAFAPQRIGGEGFQALAGGIL